MRTPVKVASYNIHKAVGGDGRRRPERILAVLAELDADIVVLQEADRRFGTRLAALPFDAIAATTPYRPVPYAIRPGGLGWHGNAILVRHGATIAGFAPLALPSIEPRGAVLAEIVVAGWTLRVVGMHLDLSGLRRRRQARAVVAAVAARAPLPTVLLGDLNEWRRDGGCLVDFAPGFRLAPTGPSFPARRPLVRLDRIMAGDGVEIVDAGAHRTVLAQAASDHLPVWARLVPVS